MKKYRGNDKINGVIWYEYPVLEHYRTVTVFAKSPHHYCRIKLGRQDGKIVAGYDYEFKTGLGGGCNPGRKWGEFESVDEALECQLTEISGMLQNRKDPTDAEKDALRRILKFIETKLIQNDLFDYSSRG